MSRPSHCPAGHPYTVANSMVRKGGSRPGRRECRECQGMRNRGEYAELYALREAWSAAHPPMRVPDGMKYCSGCDRTRGLEHFHKCSGRKGGMQSRCIDCKQQAQRERRRHLELREPVVAAKTCARCRQTKSVASFSRQSDTKDGLNRSCKPCARTATLACKARNRRRHANKVRDPNKMKYCSGCMTDKPETLFGMCATSTDGLTHNCIRCKRTLDRKNWKVRKEAAAERAKHQARYGRANGGRRKQEPPTKEAA